MSRDRQGADGERSELAPPAGSAAPGKRTRTAGLVQLASAPSASFAAPAAPPTLGGTPPPAEDPFDWTALTGPFVQRSASGAAAASPDDVHAAATAGVDSPTAPLPFHD